MIIPDILLLAIVIPSLFILFAMELKLIAVIYESNGKKYYPFLSILIAVFFLIRVFVLPYRQEHSLQVVLWFVSATVISQLYILTNIITEIHQQIKSDRKKSSDPD